MLKLRHCVDIYCKHLVYICFVLHLYLWLLRKHSFKIASFSIVSDLKSNGSLYRYGKRIVNYFLQQKLWQFPNFINLATVEQIYIYSLWSHLSQKQTSKLHSFMASIHDLYAHLVCTFVTFDAAIAFIPYFIYVNLIWLGVLIAELAGLCDKNNSNYSCDHYDDIIMGTIASQITSLTIVYSIVYSGADQSKHQSSASLAFVWGIHRGPVNSPHKWPVTRKMFPFDDVIMLNSIWCATKACSFIGANHKHGVVYKSTTKSRQNEK